MNLKKEIYKACEPPEPKGRDIFLAAIPYPKLTYPEFVLSQIGYIRKRMWIISAFILLAGIFTACVAPYREMTLLWVLSSLAPFLAVLTAAEISRSDIFGMSEIEAGCRFALPQVIAALKGIPKSKAFIISAEKKKTKLRGECYAKYIKV